VGRLVISNLPVRKIVLRDGLKAGARAAPPGK
jgi:hypothetical protein